ncbi:MAG: sulfite exporter TauE/SafE family protein [SAR202 cluster bacterium]|nr:sulfite exporter TauE/SafE family protein [SAR202 cluster bacterium]
MPEAIPLVVTVAAVFIGSVLASAVGFGIGMVGMPIILLVLAPQTAVIMVNTMALGLEAGILSRSWKHVRVRSTLPLVLAGLAGAPIGVFILANVSAGRLRIGISSLIILLALVLVFSSRRDFRVPVSQILGPILAFSVGVMGPALGVGGPLIAILLLARNWNKQEVRANLVFCFIGIDAVSFLGYAASGLFTLERVVLILFAIPAMLLGLKVGSALLTRMNEQLFRRVTMAIIISTSLLVLGREVIS